LTQGRKKFGIILFGVMMAAAVLESFGLSLFLPLISSLINPEGEMGRLMNYSAFLLKPFPDKYRITILLSIIALAVLAKNTLLVLLKGMEANFALKLREDWSLKILSNYLTSTYDEIINHQQGVLIHNSVIEPFRVSKSIIQLLDLTAKAVMAVVVFAMMMLIHWQVSMATAVLGLVVFYLTKNVLFNYSVKFGKMQLATSQKVGALTTESLSALKELKIYGHEHYYDDEIKANLSLFTRIHTKFAIFNSLPDRFLELFAVVSLALVIIVVQLTKMVDLKTLLPILGFFSLAGLRLFSYVSFIMTQHMKVFSALPSLRLISELISGKMPQEVLDQGEGFNRLEGDIVFKDVSFAYAGNSPVFDDLSIVLAKNKMTAVIGPSGVGKSTVADLLMRLFSPQGGTIRANGKNIADFNLASWRSQIGYVGQDPFLFNLSIRRNIALGKPAASDHEIDEAARMANIYDFIQTLPDGYETVVGDRGVKLSGGQRQRIVIARAIIRNPELFIFDEATSALDSETEAIIQQSIDRLAGDKTILVIAHRLSTIEKADVVYDLGKMLTRKPETHHA
jgi:subfamily B ATP-binding cassette protein MsbA